jgi:hypothetical protein
MTQEDIDQMNQLDRKITESMVGREKELKPIPKYWWSVKLHKAHLLVKYWTLQLSIIRNNFDGQEALADLTIQLSDKDIFQGNPNKTIYGQIRYAKKKRKALRNNSFELRQEFLAKLAEDKAEHQNDSTKKEQILRSTKRAEAQ